MYVLENQKIMNNKNGYRMEKQLLLVKRLLSNHCGHIVRHAHKLSRLLLLVIATPR